MSLFILPVKAFLGGCGSKSMFVTMSYNLDSNFESSSSTCGGVISDLKPNLSRLFSVSG